MLMPFLCDYVTSFNYDGQKARDVGFSCRSPLANLIPDDISHEKMGQDITCFVVSVFFYYVLFSLFLLQFCLYFSVRCGSFVFLGMKEMESALKL